MDDLLKDAAKAKLLITTLQKYGYDLQDPMAADSEHDAMGEQFSPSASATSPAGRASNAELPSPSSLDESYAPRPSFSSASILQLREKKNNQTALHIAVKKGHVDVLKALAKLPRVQDHINAGDRHANTALHFAASSAKDSAPEMVELLLNMGASVNAVNVRGQTPLAIHIMTARHDSASIAKQLAAKGMELNTLINGTTYLHMATENNLIEIACALVTAGASINVPNHNGATVGDVIPKKALIRLIAHMKKGTQVVPNGVIRKCCQICKNPKGLLETLKDCNLCGRTVCKNDSQKASEVHAQMQEGGESLNYKIPSKEKETGRLCTVCCTVVLLRDKQQKAKAGFNQKLFGGSSK
ncbi:Myosin-like protein, partial [Globisporangium splendens]